MQINKTEKTKNIKTSFLKKRIFFSFLVCSTFAFAQEKDSVAIQYSKNILAEEMSKNLHVLASDEYEGRETGKRGQAMAAEYISKQFKEAGIPPYKKDTYYQPFSLNKILPTLADISINEKQYEGNKDYYNFPGQGEQRIEGSEVLFLGYGIAEKAYNDYDKIDVKDKIVMVLDGEPVSKDSISFVTGVKIKEKSQRERLNASAIKKEKAKQAGAKALLIVVDDVAKDVKVYKNRLDYVTLSVDENTPEMPVIYISRQMANDILKKNNIQKIEKKIVNDGKPQNFSAKTNIVITIKNNAQKESSENVLGYIEGSDLKDQLIVVSAHYDHLGMDGTTVYNGADDDGSGTVAVIQMAKAFAKAKQEGHCPRRSMLFMTFAGEEKGLLGSGYYTSHPEYSLQNTVCDLNVDMIGRIDKKHEGNPNYIYLIGSDKLSSQLHTISENANKTYSNLELDYTYDDPNDRNRFYYRSDHYNFAKHGIPVIFYFNGVHDDYHQPTDDVEKIDFNKMEKITRLVFFTAWELANRNERIVVDSNKK